jgi:hypothetical protein
LTKIDKIDPRIKLSQPDSIHLAYESGVVYYYRQTLAKELGVSVDHILPVVCYDGTFQQTVKQFEMKKFDSTSLSLLRSFSERNQSLDQFTPYRMVGKGN